MRDYGRVYSTFWTRADTKSLSDDGKLLAVYLQSCEHGTMAGVCRLPDLYVSEDLGWEPERVAEGFGELSRKGFAIRCAATKWVWLINFFDGVAYNPNQWKAARKIAASVPPECSWRAAYQQRFGEAAGDLPKGSETVQKGSPSVTVPEPASLTEGGSVYVSGSDAREPPQTTQTAADIAAAPELPPKQPAPMQSVANVARGALDRLKHPAPKTKSRISEKPISKWDREDLDEYARRAEAEKNAN
jgi:hypothetical protein